MTEPRKRIRRAGTWISIAVSIAAAVAVGQHARAEEAAVAAPARFSVEVIGQGPDVILIPGLSTPREVWQPAATKLAAHHRVHLVQLRGFGEAAGSNASGPVLAPFVDELSAYIERQGLKRPAVIGHSLGGLAALMLAADHPAQPGRVMVVDALPFIGTLFDPAATVEAIRARADQMRAMILAAPAAAPLSPAPDCAALTGEAPPVPGTMARRASSACQVALWSAAADPRVTAQALYDDMTTDMRPKLGAITAPLTVLYAQDERVLAPDRSAAIWHGAYAAVPQAKVVPVPAAAHFLMLDQPEPTLAAIEGFLAAD